MHSLISYLVPYKKEIIGGFIFKLLEAIFELLIPLMMIQLIDIGIKQHQPFYIYRMGFLMIALGGVGFLFALFCQYLASKASQGIGTKLRHDLFFHIQQLSKTELDSFGEASLVNRLTHDVNQVQWAIAMFIRLASRVPFLMIGSLVMVYFISSTLFLFFLIVTILIAFILWLVLTKSLPFYPQLQQQLDRISSLMMENLAGAAVIRSFAQQKRQHQQFNSATQQHQFSSLSVGRIVALLNPLTSVTMNSGIFFVLWISFFQVQKGILLQGQIVALVNYMTQSLFALIILANLVMLFTKAYTSAQRIQAVFSCKPTILAPFTPITHPVSSHSPLFQIENLSFYHDHALNPTLSNLSLSLQKGQTIGIIGATASGKSTFIYLLLRLYNPSKGRILLDGIDISQYPLAQLRQEITLVPQQSFLFYGSILDNLLMANPAATHQEIDHALSLSQCHEFIQKLPHGVHTILSQQGNNLSGGQKQRLNIARAWLRNAKVLILDDSFSALDYATHAALSTALQQQAAEKTLFIVTQRVNTIQNADTILVFHHGKIVGQGNHAWLSIHCNIYREIALSQQIHCPDIEKEVPYEKE